MSTDILHPRMPQIPLAGPLCLFLLGGALGILASYDMSLSAAWLLWLSVGTLVYVGIVTIVRDDARLYRIAAAYVVVATLAALLIIIQYRHLGFEEKFGIVVRLGMLTSASFPPLRDLSLQQNAAATFLEGALPLTIGLAAALRGWARLPWIVCALIIGWGVLLTGSRGAWVALSFGVALVGLGAFRHITLHRARTLLLLILGGGVVIGLFLIGTTHWQHLLVSAMYRANERLLLYRNSLFLALEFPITGIGPGATFGMVYSHFQLLIPVFYLGYAHNLFLGIWLGQGLLGLIGFGGLLLGSGQLVWRGILRGSGGQSNRIVWGSAIGCAVVLFHGLIDAPQYGDGWYALLMIFALFGIMIAAARLTDARPLCWLRLNRSGCLAVVLMLSGILILFMRPLFALASANYAAVLEAHSALRPQLDDDRRAAIHKAAIAWADRGLQFDADSNAALKERGMLAFSLSERDYGLTIRLLTSALRQSPADQSMLKALGYAYVWDDHISQGVQLLKELDRAGEIAGELQVWQQAWRDRGRIDLANRAQRAAALVAAADQQ